MSKKNPKEEILLRVDGDAGELRQVLPPPLEKYKKSFRSYWSSPESFGRAVRAFDRKKAWHNSAWTGTGKDWYGTDTMEEALELAENGWQEGTQKVSRLQNRILAKNPIMLKRKKFSIAGAYPDVPRAISGNPLNMRVPDSTKASRRVVITFLSDMAASCAYGGDEFINRAAVVAALIDAVEAAGYACDVITFANSHNGYWGSDGSFNFCSCIQVKNSDQPVDVARLAFGMGHPAMFRRLVFAEKGAHDYNRDLEDGLGCSADIDITGLAERNIFLIPSIRKADGAFETEEKAETDGLKFVINSLREQGFPLFGEETEVEIVRDQTVPPVKKKKRG